MGCDCPDGDVHYGDALTDNQGHYQLLLPLQDTQMHYLLEVTKEAFEDFDALYKNNHSH